MLCGWHRELLEIALLFFELIVHPIFYVQKKDCRRSGKTSEKVYDDGCEALKVKEEENEEAGDWVCSLTCVPLL